MAYPPRPSRRTSYQQAANAGTTTPSPSMIDAEHNDFVEQIDQLNTFVRGITTSTGQLRNQSQATAQALAGAQRFVATASQTTFDTTIAYVASFTNLNVDVAAAGIDIDPNLVTVSNNAGNLRVVIPAQPVNTVVQIQAFESGAGVLVRLANTGSSSDGANMIGIQDTGALIAATTVEGALAEIVTTALGLASALGTISDLWKRNGSNAATANIPMGGFKFTGMADGSAPTDSATVNQVSALNTAISNLGSTFVRKDGTTPMTGPNPFNAGNYRIINVATPTAGTDAATKSYVDGLTGNSTPAGVVVPYVGNTAPTGWLLCNGAAQSRTTYAALYAVIGASYGAGDGATTFNVPNLQGRVPMGAGNGAQDGVNSSGVITGGTAIAIKTVGQFGGEVNHLLTVAELASHSHGLNISAGTDEGGDPAIFADGINAYQARTSLATGTDSPHNNLQPYVVFNYIIKY